MKKILFLILLFSIKSFSQKNFFAGIEIGSKGVKLSIVSLNVNSDGEFSYSVKKDTSLNTEIISFKNLSITESANAVNTFYNLALQNYAIPDRRSVIVISSGVMQQAQITNNLDKIELLKKLILEKIPNKNKTIDFLTPETEARLVHLGTIRKDDRDGAIIIDVGSGNTKGGHFDKENLFTPFNFNWGTTKIKNEVNKKQPESIVAYNSAVRNLTNSIKTEEISAIFNQKTIIRNQPFMIMGGGISWVVVTLMKPDNMDKAFVELNINDVKEFQRNVLYNYENFKDNTRATNQNAIDEFIKVNKNFDQKAMLAGASLLEAIMEDLNSTSPTKRYYFARYSSWLTGYIVKIVAGENEIEGKEREIPNKN